MKTIVIYYSLSGNNELLANCLQAKLGCHSERITELKKRTGLTITLDFLFSRTPKIHKTTTDIQEYDQVILLSPVWLGKVASPMKAFIRQERKRLARYSFISLCGGGNVKLLDELTGLAGCAPDRLLELKVGDLNRKDLPSDKVQKDELLFFDTAIDHFLKEVMTTSPLGPNFSV